MKRTVSALLAGLITVLASGTSQAEEYCVAFWNVENLFDMVDDPSVEGDEEYLPTSEKRWGEERYNKKQDDLARVIWTMHNGRGPDVLGLSEVENRTVLEDLIKRLNRNGREYKIVHNDSPSGRGIDCALLYDSKRCELEKARFHKVGDRRTREIVEVELELDDEELHVFVNHWPSRGGDREGVGRIAAAKIVRERVEELMDDEDDADFIIMGDLNDHPTDPSVSKVLRTWGNPQELKEGTLFNSTWSIHSDPKQGTYYYRDNWEVIDHMICSPGLLDPDGLAWKPGSTKVIKNDFQCFNYRGVMRPNRTFEGRGPKYFGGISDHLPLECVLLVEGDDD